MDRTEIVTMCSQRVGKEAIPELVEQFVDEASEMILNYINRQIMPDGCKMIWVSVATDLYKYNNRDFSKAPEYEAGSVPLANVSHVKIDDAEVEDGITGAWAAVSMGQINKEIDFLKDYKGRLHPFRKLRWKPI